MEEEQKYYKLIVESSRTAMVVCNLKKLPDTDNLSVEILFSNKQYHNICKTLAFGNSDLHSDFFFKIWSVKILDSITYRNDNLALPSEFNIKYSNFDYTVTLSEIIDNVFVVNFTDTTALTESYLPAFINMYNETFAKSGLWYWIEETGEHYWSNSLYQIHGINPENGIPTIENYLSIVHPLDREKLGNTLDNAINHSKNFTIEYRIFNATAGKYIYVKSTCAKIFLHKQNLFLGITQDINIQKQFEENLIESESRWNSLIQYTNDIIVITDLNLKVTYINKTLPAPLSNGFINSSIIDYVSSDKKQEIIDLVEKVKQSGSLEIVELLVDLSHLNAKFSPFWYLIKIVPLLKNLINEGFLLILSNITNDKVQKQQLTEAKEKAEENSRLKSAFLQNMSHEIRTPLNAIIGFADMLHSEKVSAQKQVQFTEIIMNSGNQLLAIVSDILAISTLETGQEQLLIRPINLNNLLKTIYWNFKDKAHQQNLALYVKTPLPDEYVTIEADELKLQHVFSNLLSNAFKYTHSGYVEFGYKVHFEANIKTSNTDLAEIEFYVKDTGTGIEKSQQSHIFERFNKKANTSFHNGTGLGLAICKGYIELMGGNIYVDSDKGKGALFTFTHPYNSLYNNNLTKRSFAQMINTLLSSKPKLLVVEDEINNYEYIEEILRNFELYILHAKTGIEAIEICSQTPDIALVIMDIKIPEIDGIEATRIIKERYPEITIVAYTAYALEAEIINFEKKGFAAYLTKPANRDQIISLIKTYINI